MADLVQMIERTGLSLATVMARKEADYGAIIAALGDGELHATGPGTWLAVSDASLDELPDRLRGQASVSDQSGGYIVYRFAGPGARRLLQRGAFIDLDPEAFGPGAVAVTAIAHMGVILWQVDAAPTYDVAIFRSHAESFRHWVEGMIPALAPISA